MLFVLCASVLVLATGCAAAMGEHVKPVVMRHFPASNDAIYDRWKGSVTYGEPKELRRILSRMHALCSQGAGASIQGLPPAKNMTLVQIDDYAFVEGACGDPSLHLVLIERGPQVATWLVDQCTWKRNAETSPLPKILAGKDGCWIPDRFVSRMLLVRSRAVPAYCKTDPQSDVLCPGFRYDAGDSRFIQTLRRQLTRLT